MSERSNPAGEITTATINGAAFEHGNWMTCSGCHESNEGHPTGPWSDALRCRLGCGCRECGGIGAIWDQYPSEQQLREFDTSDVTRTRAPTVSEETVNHAIQDLFDAHREKGTMVALVAALLDVQALVIATVDHDGTAEVHHAFTREATSATVAAVLGVVSSTSAALGAR